MPAQSRLKIVPIAHELILSLLSTGWPACRIVRDGLPTDAILVGVRTDGRTLFLTYQSPSFPEVDEGAMIPELLPQFERIASDPPCSKVEPAQLVVDTCPLVMVSDQGAGGGRRTRVV